MNSFTTRKRNLTLALTFLVQAIPATAQDLPPPIINLPPPGPGLPVSTPTEPHRFQRVLQDETTMVALELTPDSVFCTDRGYGNVQLKVSVPDLDHLAHFDHRVVGEERPCITGGQCSIDLQPGDILNPEERLAIVPMRVTLTQNVEMDFQNRTCKTRLSERVRSHIRGIDFNHYRAGTQVETDFEACQKLKNL